MKIYIDKLCQSRIQDLSYKEIDFIYQSKDKHRADLILEIVDWNTYVNKLEHYSDNPHSVLILKNFPKQRLLSNRHLRRNYYVDNSAAIPFNKFKNIFFSPNDFHKKDYIIPIFMGASRPEIVGKSNFYWMQDKLNQNTNFHNQVFWRGQTLSHDSRINVYNFYQQTHDSRFKIESFKENLYINQGVAGVYDEYMHELSCSDIAYVLRGDRAWAHSFHDVIRAGCIPIMISSLNDYGWENILNNIEEYFLRFDIRKQSIEYIHEQVCNLLEDKDRVLQMKANIRKLYQTFFNNKAAESSGELILAKCLDIYKNNFNINKIDNKFICSQALRLKQLKGKL